MGYQTQPGKGIITRPLLGKYFGKMGLFDKIFVTLIYMISGIRNSKING